MAQPGRYMFRFGWLAITADDLAVWEQFPDASFTLVKTAGNPAPYEAEEYRLIREAMVETRGGIRRAAARLAMSPQALLRRLEKWPELRGKTT